MASQVANSIKDLENYLNNYSKDIKTLIMIGMKKKTFQLF